MLDQSQSGVRQSAGDQHPWHRNLRSHDGVSISKSRMVVGSCCVSPLSIIMARPRRTTRSLWRRRRLVCIREMPSYCARHNDIGEGVGMRTRRASVGVHWVSELPIETTSIQRMLTGTRCISRTSKRTSSHSTTWYQRHTVSWRHKTEGKAREGSALPWQPATVLVVAKGRCAREGLGAQSRHHRSETCAGLLLGDSGSKAARHTVPWIWKKGRPALVCQLWGDCAQQRRR